MKKLSWVFVLGIICIFNFAMADDLKLPPKRHFGCQALCAARNVMRQFFKVYD